MNELHLFAGAGGGILGGLLLGHTPVCAVELEPYRRKVLIQRQRDGILPRFPVWDDVQTFDGKPWRGRVDAVCGGFPCQDISASSSTHTGLDGERSGLWREMHRVVCEVRPRFVFVENSPNLLIRGLGRILGEMAALGFDAKWGVFSGRHVGAPIEKERLFVACANKEHGETRVGDKQSESEILRTTRVQCPSFWLQTPSERFGVEHGLDSYMDQVAAIGDGQIPIVVALAWRSLFNQLITTKTPGI